MKKLLLMMSIVAVFMFAVSMPAFAKDGSHHKWDAKEGKFSEYKVYKKVKKIKKYQKELGFSDGDVDKAKAVKMALKRDLIQLNADIDIVKLDIETARSKDALDVAVINSLIDQKYILKNKREKRILSAYAQVKGMFTPQQKTKMKELYSSSKECSKKGSDKVCLKCKKGKK